MKCHALQELKIVPGFDCTDANRVQLFEFAGLAVSKSKCFRKLDLMCTLTSGEVGDKFMEMLADENNEHMTGMTEIRILSEKYWFGDGRSGCLTPLLALLAKQTGLKTIEISYCDLSTAQKEQIREIVT